MEFIDFNDQCRKYCFSLLRCVILMKSTKAHEMLRLMDVLSPLNYIKIQKNDIPKISFLSDFNVSLCLVMNFGIKNAPTT